MILSNRVLMPSGVPSNCGLTDASRRLREVPSLSIITFFILPSTTPARTAGTAGTTSQRAAHPASWEESQQRISVPGKAVRDAVVIALCHELFLRAPLGLLLSRHHKPCLCQIFQSPGEAECSALSMTIAQCIVGSVLREKAAEMIRHLIYSLDWCGRHHCCWTFFCVRVDIVHDVLQEVQAIHICTHDAAAECCKHEQERNEDPGAIKMACSEERLFAPLGRE
mmetsp:Transcript_120609/g.219225  ORF Transcript_120609/g.219225 Transcript_120609/m.219225 type:complete len:224 (-) Transcript_120609:1684-2355(-)